MALGTVAGVPFKAGSQSKVPAAAGIRVSVAAGKSGETRARIQVARINRGTDFLKMDIWGRRLSVSRQLTQQPM
jgi:hypothetical protein